MMFFKCGGELHSENTFNILNLCQEKFEIACWLPAWDLWKFGPSLFCSRYLWVPRLCCGGLHPQIIPLKVTNAFYSYLGSYWQWSAVFLSFIVTCRARPNSIYVRFVWFGIEIIAHWKANSCFHYFRSKHTLAFISYYFLFNLLKYSIMKKFNFNNLSPTHTNLYSVQPRFRLRKEKASPKTLKFGAFLSFKVWNLIFP